MSRVVRPRRPSSSSAVAASNGDAPFGRPDFQIPDLPRDLTIISDDRLMQLFSEYVAWQNFAATEFSLAEVAEERATAEEKRVEAMALITLEPGKGTITLAKANLSVSRDVEAARQARLNAYAARKMTQVIRDNCERCAALVSRELSRRIGRDPIERRQMRWSP
jgi:hypothetical protein